MLTIKDMLLPIHIVSHAGEGRGRLELITTDVRSIPQWITDFFKKHKGANDNIIISGRDGGAPSIMIGRIDGHPISIMMDADNDHRKGDASEKR